MYKNNNNKESWTNLIQMINYKIQINRGKISFIFNFQIKNNEINS